MLGPSGCPPRRRGEDRVHDVSDLQAGSTGEAVGGQGRLQMARELGRSWWVLLLLGIVWVLLGMFVLSYRVGSLLALAIMAGVVFILSGVAELAAASRAPSWRWLYVVSGLLSVIAGAIAIIWPGITLFVLSVVLSWLLVFVNLVGFYALIHGFTEIFGAFTVREVARHPERA